MKKTLEKPRRGRPKLPAGARKDRYLDSIRFSQAELEGLRARAAASGKTFTEWVRGRLGL